MKLLLFLIVIVSCKEAFGWGFFGHKLINRHAVYLLPPEMMALYKPAIDFLTEHSVDPDKRRYVVEHEAPRHYIDLDMFNPEWFEGRDISWQAALESFPEDTLIERGIVPWWIQVMLNRLTSAFKEKNWPAVLKISAELGHYVSDAHVPLHASSNHNGQLTGQHGIHGFWESRIPELYAETEWDVWTGSALYINNPLKFTWNRVKESAKAADTVLVLEKQLNEKHAQIKYSFENRNGMTIKQYSSAYSELFDRALGGMVEQRLRQSILSVASFWFTAWVNAGQPDCRNLASLQFGTEEQMEFAELNEKWKENLNKGRICE